MALDVDTLLDRRRQTRRIAFWRALAFLLVLGAVAVAVLTLVRPTAPHVARLPINGAIVSDRPLVQLIERLGEDDGVAGILVAIDSPGGTTVGGERLYDALRDLAARKPVVAHINTLGASAAYMTALASDHIVAHRTSLTGSIGVLIQFGQINELLDDLGITVTKVDTGPLKAEPNPFEPVDPAAIDMLQGVVNDTYAWFLSLVVERRDIPEPEARRLADGRIFTGHQALEARLIDALGGEDQAIAWLVEERNVPRGLPVRTYKARSGADLPFTARMADHVLDRIFAAIGMSLPPLRPVGSVDGLWSVWHASFSSDIKVKKND
ncbi:signal peptide peptidase SppA [Acuticoccus sp.]|uniref:signal peptide peptidase SppA n=1 Tax=Acuticoccus sp. TaxID=1904378 RepID=UPI003B52ED3E